MDPWAVLMAMGLVLIAAGAAGLMAPRPRRPW
jgi:hypothetical protein